jgi:hypothetical protein
MLPSKEKSICQDEALKFPEMLYGKVSIIVDRMDLAQPVVDNYNARLYYCVG